MISFESFNFYNGCWGWRCTVVISFNMGGGGVRCSFSLCSGRGRTILALILHCTLFTSPLTLIIIAQSLRIEKAALIKKGLFYNVLYDSYCFALYCFRHWRVRISAMLRRKRSFQLLFLYRKYC